MALSQTERDRLTRANDLLRLQIRDRITNYALTLWGPTGQWRGDEVDAFVERLVPVVEAGQLRVAAITQAYVAKMLDAPVSAEVVDVTKLRGGVTPTEVYQRPAVTMRDKLSKGTNFDKAMSAASARLANLIATDLQLTMTHQSRAALESAGEGWGFRRFLTGRENCDLCATASTNRYTRSDLLPIHPHCDCGVEPIQGDWGDDLSLAETPVIVREHGEYGPTLAWRDQQFTGPADI